MHFKNLYEISNYKMNLCLTNTEMLNMQNPNLSKYLLFIVLFRDTKTTYSCIFVRK